MERSYIEWKWSNGISYNKSSRRIVELTNNDTEIIESTTNDSNAIRQSLDDQLGSYNETLFSRNDGGNRREETYSKMADREMINQINQNPFLLNTDYVNDLATQDKYLKPISTTFEKVK
jgi:hypothetical protein